MLKLKNITLKWISPVEKILIENLNIEIENSEILCVFGESGVGKSSLINVISGVHEENLSFEGEIRLNGKNLNNTPAEKRKIGLLLQDGTLFPHLTVEQNLLFGMNKSLKRSLKNSLIIEYLDKANLLGFQDRYPNSLSGGQKARIACLRAILSEPDALLLDEPFSSLDPTQRDSFRQFVVKHVKKANIPCLLVTHNEGDKIISDKTPLNLTLFRK
ncbi:ATP-binding cassette domain-containing protein [Alphaproteobacteria bacterium]|nr:ATP-binding cassette domain-containing protein [Alphaproteobacteria bacterium]